MWASFRGKQNKNPATTRSKTRMEGGERERRRRGKTDGEKNCEIVTVRWKGKTHGGDDDGRLRVSEGGRKRDDLREKE